MDRKVNDFGKFCRTLRIKNDMVLKDMSDILDVSPAYLSAVETGKRKIPKDWGNILSNKFRLNDEEKTNLDTIIQLNETSFFDNYNIKKHDDKTMLIQLARKCQDITPTKYAQIIKILEGDDNNES